MSRTQPTLILAEPNPFPQLPATVHEANYIPPSCHDGMDGSLWRQLRTASDYTRVVDSATGRREQALPWLLEQYVQSLQSQASSASSSSSTQNSTEQPASSTNTAALRAELSQCAANIRDAPSLQVWDAIAVRWNRANTAMPDELYQSLLNQCIKPEMDSESDEEEERNEALSLGSGEQQMQLSAGQSDMMRDAMLELLANGSIPPGTVPLRDLGAALLAEQHQQR